METLLEHQEIFETLNGIKKKYKYKTSEAAISHYLEKVYPDPDYLDSSDKQYYYGVKSFLEEHYRG